MQNANQTSFQLTHEHNLIIGMGIQKYLGNEDLTALMGTMPGCFFVCLTSLKNNYNREALSGIQVLLLCYQIFQDLVDERAGEKHFTFNSFMPEDIGKEITFSYYLPIDETILNCKAASEYFLKESMTAALDDDILMDAVKYLKAIQLVFTNCISTQVKQVA